MPTAHMYRASPGFCHYHVTSTASAFSCLLICNGSQVNARARAVSSFDSIVEQFGLSPILFDDGAIPTHEQRPTGEHRSALYFVSMASPPRSPWKTLKDSRSPPFLTVYIKQPVCELSITTLEVELRLISLSSSSSTSSSSAYNYLGLARIPCSPTSRHSLIFYIPWLDPLKGLIRKQNLQSRTCKLGCPVNFA